MLIRKLKLAGFKSFVEPAELRIEPGLTGVVGPNGCGKSNLLEAIRWVMGESSPKSMRGAGMDDVIFAGTALRPAREFAEVSLLVERRPEDIGGDASAPAGEVVRITVGTDAGADLRFEPAEVSVPAGSSVELTFQNQATVPHNLTFQGAITAATATTVEPGASDTVEFQAPAPGSYPFVCTLHPGMEGTLVVTAS